MFRAFMMIVMVGFVSAANASIYTEEFISEKLALQGFDVPAENIRVGAGFTFEIYDPEVCDAIEAAYYFDDEDLGLEGCLAELDSEGNVIGFDLGITDPFGD